MADTIPNATPIEIVATISRLVSKVTDRVTGDRSEFPLLVAAVTKSALEHYKIGCNIFYGPAAWIEVLEDASPLWVGCWGKSVHIWAASEFGEVIDLCVGVSFRKRAHANPNHQPKYSPPLVWSKDLPVFYRYKVDGVAEVALDSNKDKEWFELCDAEVKQKLPQLTGLRNTPFESLEFPDEPILCPNRRILDDAGRSFQFFDRSLKICGIPPAPTFA